MRTTKIITLVDGRQVLDRKARRIGGKNASENERHPAMCRLRDSAGETRDLGWKWQCYCGSTSAKSYRNAWWCPVCGREKLLPVDS